MNTTRWPKRKGRPRSTGRPRLHQTFEGNWASQQNSTGLAAHVPSPSFLSPHPSSLPQPVHGERTAPNAVTTGRLVPSSTCDRRSQTPSAHCWAVHSCPRSCGKDPSSELSASSGSVVALRLAIPGRQASSTDSTAAAAAVLSPLHWANRPRFTRGLCFSIPKKPRFTNTFRNRCNEETGRSARQFAAGFHLRHDLQHCNRATICNTQS